MAGSEKAVEVVMFDLNGTFYSNSSKDEFYKFLLFKKPRKATYYLQMLYYKLLLKVNAIRKTEFKENFFNYLDNMPPKQVEKYAAEFWQQEYPSNFNAELKRILDKHRQNGAQVFCATGGLELYVKPLFDLYKVDGMFGTIVEYKNNTYKVQGLACKDEEKIKRLDKHFKGRTYRIIEAYSDSKETILDKADKAFLVKDGNLTPYSA